MEVLQNANTNEGVSGVSHRSAQPSAQIKELRFDMRQRV
jgi:hypothetical protein